MTQVPLHKFYFDGIVRARMKQERYGQAMFNHLLTIRPDLAKQVAGTDKDPFHCSSPTEERFNNFVDFIERQWYVPTKRTYTVAEVKQAFWDTFHRYGEIFFDYLGNDDYSNECTEEHWQAMESNLLKE